MSAEVHKVLITTFSLVLYPVKIPEKGSFEDYFWLFYTLYLFTGAGIDMAL